MAHKYSSTSINLIELASNFFGKLASMCLPSMQLAGMCLPSMYLPIKLLPIFIIAHEAEIKYSHFSKQGY